MPALFKNNASALLASSLTTTDTTVVLSAGLGNSFPSPTGSSYFYGTLFDDLGNYEIVKCTARVTDTLTVVRAQDGTNPLEFTAGDGFALRPVAAVLNNFVQLDGANTFTGTNTFTGVNTFSAANTFTGAVSYTVSPTAPTVATPDNTTKLATTAFVTASIANIPVQVPAGSVFLLYQAAAPTGWTQVTSLDDYALRLVSSAGGTTGGTSAFSTVFANQTPSITVNAGSIGATTLSTAQIPSHTHSVSQSGAATGSGYSEPGYAGTPSDTTTGATGGGGSHTHSISGATGTSSAITLNVRYANMILCSKN